MRLCQTKFSTMDIEYQDEVWVQEFYNFVGTVGGSLGLFIGFSYTGFIAEILDYFIKDNIITNPKPNYTPPSTNAIYVSNT